ncbi:MAG: NAD-dependent epimerase/dehydratase family protein [Acidobacteriota bacterium]|nr:NAD-dependent epimerase/dehydratase family protein [Acidobacteriota bacterium]
MVTILGAGGAVSNGLVKLLTERKDAFRLVSRRAHPDPAAAEVVAADLTNAEQAKKAVAGSSVVFLLVGLAYDKRVWAEMWPRIMNNTIEACKQAGTRLVFFDNVYMYGRVQGAMTEETPFNPCSKKGEIRARIATRLMEEWKSGNLTAMIARSADFYGPGAKTGIANAMVFEPLSKGDKAMCLVNDSLPHSYTYTPDAARALVTLATHEDAWNQTWHLPTSEPVLTGREFIGCAALALNVEPKHQVLRPWMVKTFGLFNKTIGEVGEMLYQNDSPYLFNSSKYARRFGFVGTPYAEGIRATASAYR